MITPAISKDVAIGRRMNGSEMFKVEAGCRRKSGPLYAKKDAS